MLENLHDHDDGKNHRHHHQKLQLLGFLLRVHHGADGSAQSAVQDVTQKEVDSVKHQHLYAEHAFDLRGVGHQRSPGEYERSAHPDGYLSQTYCAYTQNFSRHHLLGAGGGKHHFHDP